VEYRCIRVWTEGLIMNFPKCVFARICLLCIFFNHVTVTCKYMPNFDLIATRILIIGGRFMGHLAKSAFTISLGKIQRAMFGHCSTTLPAKIYYNYQLSNKQPTGYTRRAARVRGFLQELNTYLTSFMFSFTEITFFDLAFDLFISLWSMLFNSLSK